MSKFKIQIINYFLAMSFFLSVPLVISSVYAGSLSFDKTTVSSQTGQTFQISIVVDAGTDQISSTDAYVIYDPAVVEAATVAPGTFFPIVTNNITSGKVYVAGLVDDPATSKTGSGTVATITFNSLTNGTVNLTFDCAVGANDKSKIIKNDLNATNVIVCTQNGSSAVTVGIGSGGTVQPTPSVLPKTGVLDNLLKVAVPGAIIFFLGGVLKLIL